MANDVRCEGDDCGSEVDEHLVRAGSNGTGTHGYASFSPQHERHYIYISQSSYYSISACSLENTSGEPGDEDFHGFYSLTLLGSHACLFTPILNPRIT